MTVAGQTIVVTGGAFGIGHALAARFRIEGAAAIVIADRDIAAAREAAAPIGAHAMECDVADWHSVASLVADVERAHGPIDLFCSNAGILERDPDPDNVAAADDAAWLRAWQVNVMGHVHAARAVLPSMIARGTGTILNTVSAAGLLAELSSASYTATKHAAMGFTEQLAITHRDHGIRVHALCPQGVATRMIAGAGGAEPALLDGVLSPDAVADCVIAGLATGRFLILPHPQVAAYFCAKAADHDRWIGGMAKLRRRALAAQPRDPASTKLQGVRP